jgi:hypothetical protein
VTPRFGQEGIKSAAFESSPKVARVDTVEDLSFFGCIRGAGLEQDWTDPEVWRRANPSFGITIDADQFAEDCEEARQSPAKENSFRRYRLNQWTEQDVRWLSLEKWDACGGAGPGRDPRAVRVVHPGEPGAVMGSPSANACGDRTAGSTRFIMPPPDMSPACGRCRRSRCNWRRRSSTAS